MDDFTPHELELMEKMTPEHKALMPKLSASERRSMANHVTVENIQKIQSWIGTDEEIESMLFWDEGGKFDDPEWQKLKPVDDVTAELYDKASEHYEELKKEAIESQRRSDITLFSQFNTGLLFTGLAGAVRCDAKGEAAEKGEYFKGIEWKAIGSVEEFINSITIFPTDDGAYEVHLGVRTDDGADGIWAYTGDYHSLLQLAQLAAKVLPKHGFETAVRDMKGELYEADPKVVRKAMMGGGEKLVFDGEMKLYASKKCEDVASALEAADTLSRRFYERYGLETEAYKIGKKYGNFFLMREGNFDKFMPKTPVDSKGLVLLTATLVCRRCRRELNEFRDLAKLYPHVNAALVNLSSPQFKFYERVFGDMGGGDPDNFRKTAAGVTPFIIIYAPNDEGILEFKEYVATGKSEKTPSVIEAVPLFEMYFSEGEEKETQVA